MLLINNLYSQDILSKRISIKINNKPIETVLEKIEDNADIMFSYNPAIIPLDKNITVHFKKTEIRTILDSVIQDNTISYKVFDKQIIIYRDIYFGDYGFNSNTLTIKDLSIEEDTNNFSLIKVPSEDKRDTLTISYLGYKPGSYAVTFVDSADTEIALATTSVIPIETEFWHLNPKDIITNAVRAIDNNYMTDASIYNVLFKESVEKNDKRLYFSEADLDIYKTPYNLRFTEDLVKLNFGKKYLPTSKIKGTKVKIEGGPVNILNMDIVKKRLDFIDNHNYKYYNYKLKGVKDFNGRSTYIIDFWQKKSIKEALFEGTIFIDKETLAFVKFQFELSKNGIEYAPDLFISKTPEQTKGYPFKAEYVVSYSINNNKWALNSILSQNSIAVFSSPGSTPGIFTTTSFLVVNTIETENVKYFESKDIFKEYQILSDMLPVENVTKKNKKPEYLEKQKLRNN